MIPPFLDANRPAILDRAAAVLASYRVPGGDVDAWLMALPADLIAQALDLGPPPVAAAQLFRLVGQVRRLGAGGPSIGEDGCDRTNVITDAFADGVLRVWAGLQCARALLTNDAPACAERQLRAIGRALLDLPPEVEAHFAEQLDALFTQALAALAIERANEVA